MPDRQPSLIRVPAGYRPGRRLTSSRAMAPHADPQASAFAGCAERAPAGANRLPAGAGLSQVQIVSPTQTEGPLGRASRVAATIAAPRSWCESREEGDRLGRV